MRQEEPWFPRRSGRTEGHALLILMTCISEQSTNNNTPNEPSHADEEKDPPEEPTKVGQTQEADESDFPQYPGQTYWMYLVDTGRHTPDWHTSKSTEKEENEPVNREMGAKQKQLCAIVFNTMMTKLNVDDTPHSSSSEQEEI